MKKKFFLLFVLAAIFISGCAKPYSSKGPSGDIWTTYNAGYNAKLNAAVVQQSRDYQGRTTTTTTTTNTSDNKAFSGTNIVSDEKAVCKGRTIDTCIYFSKNRSSQL